MKRFVFLFLVLGACTTKYPLPEKGVSFKLNEFRKKSISDIKYSLEFDIPEGKTTPINGKQTISFNLSDLSQPLVIDFNVDSTQIKAVSVDYQFANEHIIIRPEVLKKGLNNISIEFAAGDLSLNRNEEYLYTLFVPDRASTCFPLFDQPNLKAVYDLKLNVPEGWKSVSNQTKKPISSYLFAFAAGKFKSKSQTVDGREMTMYYRETDSIKVKKNTDEIFTLHGKALAWLEDYTQIKYPFEKFDFALIPSFQYGGMEHPGSIFYSEGALFLDDNASVNRKMGRASLIAHETAHMWFGDLVTMDWFNDVWMKEVFANFMAAKIVQPSFPEIDHNLRFFLAHYPAAYSVDRTKGANPIIQPLDNLKNAGTMYGAIIYQKAPIVMRHLEKMIGEEMMRESLQEYLQTYSYKNAVWDDLVKIIDKRTPEDIAKWSHDWVYTAGMPVIESDSVNGFDYGYFKMSDEKNAHFFNNYDGKAKGLSKGPMIINAWEAFIRGDGPDRMVVLERIKHAISLEKDPLITDLLLGELETLWWTFSTRDQEIESLLWKLTTETKDKGMQSSYYRTYVSVALTSSALNKLKDLWLGKSKIPGLTLSEDDQIDLAYDLTLKTQDTTIISSQIRNIKNPDRVARMKFVAPALSFDEKIRDEFFESLKKEENREHEAWVLEALSYLHHPLRENSREKYLRPSLDLLQEIQLTGDIFFPQRWLNTTFQGHSSLNDLEIVKKFQSDNPSYPGYLKNKILQATDMTERAAAINSAVPKL